MRGLRYYLLAVDKTKKSVAREYLEAIIIALLLAIGIRTFVVQAFKIPSGSMLPTLQIGDHLLVNKFIYGIRNPFSGKVIIPISKPKRGDVIVFKYPLDKNVDYIKRVIGTPGDTVEIKNKKLFINGKAVPDPHAHFTSDYIMPATAGPRDNFGPIKVPKGKLFCMGDNRDSSYDGRFWGFVDQQDVLGKAFIIYWSWDLDKPLLSLGRFESIRWSRFGTIIH
jgi:signal peptidase I